MMKISGRGVTLIGLAGVLVVGVGVIATQLPAIGAGGLLHPVRRPVSEPAPESCQEVTLSGADVRLKGWRCRAVGTRVGTLVYLHGIADNRTSSIGVIRRFGKRGFDVVAYDSRAHSESEGEACTYGFFEKRDLGRVLDTTDPGPIVLV